MKLVLGQQLIFSTSTNISLIKRNDLKYNIKFDFKRNQVYKVQISYHYSRKPKQYWFFFTYFDIFQITENNMSYKLFCKYNS